MSLIVKLTILATIAIVAVKITDDKGYFLSDQLNNHHERRWDSFYKFTEHDTVDIVVIGTSHAFCGVNPKNLSAALGCNCFVMAFNATTIVDSYYVLEEVLTRTHPKIVIIETYGIDNRINHELTGSGLSNQFRSFYPRKNTLLKIHSMPALFTIENYLPAWSSTMRNHELLLRNPREIKTNIQVQKEKRKRGYNNKLYLGRFVRFTEGISDSTMAKYNNLGAVHLGQEKKVSSDAVKYAGKIIRLCRDNNIEPIFITVPMYYKHIENYHAWKQTLRKAIPDDVRWLDLQEPYDTTSFTTDCFEDTYGGNQHQTYYGSLITTYKIANYIADSMNIELPQRNSTKHWHEMFYGEEGYFENYSPKPDDKNFQILAQDTTISGILITDCLLNKGKLTLKISKAGHNEGKTVLLTVRLLIDGHPYIANIDLQKAKEYTPLHHNLYLTYLRPDVKIVSINAVAIY